MTLQTNHLHAAEAVAIPTPGSFVDGLAAALSQGQSVARETVRLGVEVAKIAGGISTVSPAAVDRRFADPAWTENPMYRGLAQVYLAWKRAGHNRGYGLHVSRARTYGVAP